MTNNECQLLRRAQACRHEQVTLVLAIIIVGDDNELAARKGCYRRLDVLMRVVHLFAAFPITARMPAA
jgi:HAMP domain-containing protein